MKAPLLFLFVFFSVSLFSQKSKDFTIYLDSTKTNTTDKEFEYYRIVKDYYKVQELYNVTQYYKTGEIESEGLSASKDVFDEIGVITSYYKNGNKKSEINFNQKGNLEGKCTFWYENGEIKLNGEYITIVTSLKKYAPKKVILKIENFWNSSNVQTVTNGNGDYEDDGEMDPFNKDSFSQGKIIDGYKEGVWTGTNSTLKIQFTETFKRGVLVSGKSIDANNKEYPYEEIFARAQPRLGIEDFIWFIAYNFKADTDGQKKAIIITKFTITTEGKIVNPKTIVGLRRDLDKDIIKVINKYNDFTPGKFRGILIDCPLILPISLHADN